MPMDKDKVHIGLLQPGTIIGDSYRVEAFLGKGGMGEVWVARHLRLANRRVAVKVLRTQGEALSKEALSRFRKEAEIASRLQHPHIVNIHDYNFTSSGHPFMVMEFLEGESLGARLRREGPFLLAPTRAIIRQICRALEATHSQGILHRDLKPDNIFLTTQSGELWVKVLDFGISKILDSNTQFTQESIVVGSPRYISPEQARGQNSRLTPQSDIFSLGAVAYEMLTGKSAFEGDEVSQVLFRVVYESPTPLGELLPELPSGARHAIEMAMAKQPDKRHASALAFSEAFDKDTFVPTHTYGLSPEASRGSMSSGHKSAMRPLEAKEAKKSSKVAWLLALAVGTLAFALIGGALFYRPVLKGPLNLPGKGTTAAKTKAPGNTKAASGNTKAAPGDTKAAPGDTKAAPEETTAAPEETTATPEETTAAPGETTPVKTTKTKAPPGAKAPRPPSTAPPPPPQAAPPRSSVPPPLNAEEQRLLARAENALRARQYRDAELFARRSLTSMERNGAGWTRAYAIIAEVACAKGDVEAFNAALASVPAMWRHSIRASCNLPSN